MISNSTVVRVDRAHWFCRAVSGAVCNVQNILVARLEHRILFCFLKCHILSLPAVAIWLCA